MADLSLRTLVSPDRYNALSLINAPTEPLGPPPRAVRYRPFVKTIRIVWAAILLPLLLFPILGGMFGLTYRHFGATAPPKTALILNSRIDDRRVDSDGDDWLQLEYKVGTASYVHWTWVPSSYYSQMVGMVYAPITVPDPTHPYDFYIGPPRGLSGIPYYQLFVIDSMAFGLLGILCLWIEGKRTIEYRLLRHGYSTMGTVEWESRPEGEVQEVIRIVTRMGPAEEIVGYPTEPANCPPPGSQIPMLYMPDDPSTMKPLSEFKSCELA